MEGCLAGPDNADGLVGTKDGGILFAQEQPNTVGRLDPMDQFSIFATDTHGTELSASITRIASSA